MTWVNEYMMVPFADCGRNMQGCDCWGLVRLILQREAQIDIPAYAGTATDADAEVSGHMTNDSAMPPWQAIVERGQEQCFDVAVMKGTLRTEHGLRSVPMHVGLITAPGWILHIEKHKNAVHQQLNDFTIRRRIVSIHRHEKLV